MIRNFRERAEFYCMNDGSKMELVTPGVRTKSFYTCSGKKEGFDGVLTSKPCGNFLKQDDADGIVKLFEQIVLDDLENDLYSDYTNFRFMYRNIQVRILKYGAKVLYLIKNPTQVF